jgi:thiol-disulfide isomerase/thioredoxin
MRTVLLLALLLLPAASAHADELAAGAPAPTFSLRAVNPEVAGAGWVSLGKLVGPEAEDAGAKVVLLSFFASWCEPCKKELPLLVELDREYRALGLRVVSVDIDTEPEGIEAAGRLAADAGVRHPVCSDRFNILARRYLGEKAPLPSVFLVRRDGTVALVERGYAKDAPAFLRAAVRKELGLKPARGGGRRGAQPRR